MIDISMIPKLKSRINITLESFKDKKERTELPLKFLVWGDYSGRQWQTQKKSKRGDDMPEKVQAQHLQHLMQKKNLCLKIASKASWQSQETLMLEVPLRSLEDFHPDQILHNVSHLRQLLALRNLLAILKRKAAREKDLYARLNEKMKEHGTLIAWRDALYDALAQGGQK